MRNATTFVTGLLALALLSIVLPSAAAEIPGGDLRCEAEFGTTEGEGRCRSGAFSPIWAYKLCPDAADDVCPPNEHVTTCYVGYPDRPLCEAP